VNSPKKTARLAGVLYLLSILTGILTLRVLPSKFVVWDNAALTVENIIAHETLFRLGLVVEVIGYVAFFILPFVLYELLSGINKNVAVLMVSLAVVSVPVSFSYLLYKVNILTLIGNDPYLTSMDAGQIPSRVMLYLHYYDNGILIASIFWGLWLLPFGYLVFRSGFLPKILGVLLMAGCAGYVVNFICELLFPTYDHLQISKIVTLPASLGELGICIWFLVAGIKASSKLRVDDTS
jgi:hypothetical protein